MRELHSLEVTQCTYCCLREADASQRLLITQSCPEAFLPTLFYEGLNIPSRLLSPAPLLLCTLTFGVPQAIPLPTADPCQTPPISRSPPFFSYPRQLQYLFSAPMRRHADFAGATLQRLLAHGGGSLQRRGRQGKHEGKSTIKQLYPLEIHKL